jgi:hypothetical protein
VNTASAITRGFINAMKSGSRATRLVREADEKRDKEIAMVFMVDSSMEICLSEVRHFSFATGLVAPR